MHHRISWFTRDGHMRCAVCGRIVRSVAFWAGEGYVSYLRHLPEKRA